MRKERWLKMKVPTRLRPWLRALLARGLYGNSEEEVALRLIEKALQAMVTERYLHHYDEASTLLKQSHDIGEKVRK